jgi:hypothetical protein
MLLATYMMQSSSSTELLVRISRIAFNLSSDKQNKLMAMVSISGLFLSSFPQLSSHTPTDKDTPHDATHIFFLLKNLGGIYSTVYVTILAIKN